MSDETLFFPSQNFSSGCIMYLINLSLVWAFQRLTRSIELLDLWLPPILLDLPLALFLLVCPFWTFLVLCYRCLIRLTFGFLFRLLDIQLPLCSHDLLASFFNCLIFIFLCAHSNFFARLILGFLCIFEFKNTQKTRSFGREAKLQ